MLYEEWPNVATSHLGLDASFFGGEIGEAHFESTRSFAIVLGLGLPGTCSG